MQSRSVLRIYSLASMCTVLTCGFIGWELGLGALYTTVVLILLETTFSVDNAIVNSRVLAKLPPQWQRMFMTLGILIAVFLVRFLLPNIIVVLSTGLGFTQVFNLALHQPTIYQSHLIHAEPAINTFGGIFLLSIALNYFIDYEKNIHWISSLERRLSHFARHTGIQILIILITSIIISLTTNSAYRITVGITSGAAILTYSLLEYFNSRLNARTTISGQKLNNKHALLLFIYLEVLDASFSLDSVFGGFAITNSIIILMAGLGIGALWVRSITLHLVHSRTLVKYQFLEHGAHWAIAFLGVVMILKVYQITLPEWLIGSLGLVFIGLALIGSINHNQKSKLLTR